MEQILINAGLSPLQAQVYLFLIEHGPTVPKALTNELNITRTNAYKVLESLDELDLVYKVEQSKKLIYSPADPSALASLVSEKRNNIIALEHNVNQAMQQLRKSYSKQKGGVAISHKSGKQAMIEGYEMQSSLKEPIYFFKSRTDIPFMGFEIMDKVRRQQGSNGAKRFGITPDSPEAAKAKLLDDRTNLTRTWVDDIAYTAPVEWSVSGDNLLIQIFDDKGSTITISNAQIAKSFREIWQLSDYALKSSPDYRLRPRKAKRLV